MFKITPSQKIQSLQSKSKKFVISVSHQKQRKVFLPQSESENGRWSAEEHNRFIDAIIKYGNDWKKVQRHVATRTSTQARSHAQKFLMKLKRCELIRKKKINLNLSWAKSISLLKNELSPSEIRDVFFSVSCSKKSKNNFCEKTEDTFSTNEDEGFAFASTDNSMDIDSSNWYTENSYESSLSPKKDSEYIKCFFDSFNTRKISFEINDIDALYLTSCGK